MYTKRGEKDFQILEIGETVVKGICDPRNTCRIDYPDYVLRIHNKPSTRPTARPDNITINLLQTTITFVPPRT